MVAESTCSLELVQRMNIDQFGAHLRLNKVHQVRKTSLVMPIAEDPYFAKSSGSFSKNAYTRAGQFCKERARYVMPG